MQSSRRRRRRRRRLRLASFVTKRCVRDTLIDLSLLRSSEGGTQTQPESFNVIYDKAKPHDGVSLYHISHSGLSLLGKTQRATCKLATCPRLVPREPARLAGRRPDWAPSGCALARLCSATSRAGTPGLATLPAVVGRAAMSWFLLGFIKLGRTAAPLRLSRPRRARARSSAAEARRLLRHAVLLRGGVGRARVIRAKVNTLVDHSNSTLSLRG